jgi:ribonucleoside-diphosphate reductase alpha chain
MKIRKISKGQEKHTYDFEVKGYHEYLMENGVVSHNTSSSVFMDAGAGFMPVYSAFFREDNSLGKYPVTCMYIKENPLSYARSFRTYNQAQLAETVGAVQKFVDTGISAEYLLDQNKEGFSAKDLYDVLISAWKNGTKAVYYIRSIKKGESVEDLLGIKEEGCSGCAG